VRAVLCDVAGNLTLPASPGTAIAPATDLRRERPVLDASPPPRASLLSRISLLLCNMRVNRCVACECWSASTGSLPAPSAPNLLSGLTCGSRSPRFVAMRHLVITSLFGTGRGRGDGAGVDWLRCCEPAQSSWRRAQVGPVMRDGG
jgi:hypothetical protein